MPKKNYRSAINGRFVKKTYADKHPKTTVGETRTKPKAPKKK